MEKIVEQGYNYLDGPIHSMAEFFETRIENLEKSIPLSVLSSIKKKIKVPRKGKECLLTILRMMIQKRNIQVRSFASTMVREDVPRSSVLS